MSTITANVVRILSGVESGHARFDKFAIQPNVTSTIKDVWDTSSGDEAEVEQLSYLGGLGNAETLRIERFAPLSDVAGGPGAQSLFILGIDDDGYFQQNLYPFGVTNPFDTADKWLRVFRMIVLGVQGPGGDSHIPNVGDISAYASTANTLQARITAGSGITQMSHFTIPRGFIGTGYVLAPMAGIGREIEVIVRSSRNIQQQGVYLPDNMGPFIKGRNYTITEGVMPHTEHSLIPELSDLHFEARLLSAGAGVTFSMFYQMALMRTSLTGLNNLETITAEIIEQGG